MSSGSTQNLYGVWAEGETGYMVGGSGTVVKLSKGRCTPMEVPTSHHLRAIWGLGPKLVLAVGDNGTILWLNGSLWQPSPVPTQISFHCIWGSGPENICIGGQDTTVLRYDGASWNPMSLPGEGMVSQFCTVNGIIYAAGGSPRGGEIYRRSRGFCCCGRPW